MYVVYNSYFIVPENIVYKHKHFNKVINYLKHNKLKLFYVSTTTKNNALVFSSNHYLVNHLTIKQQKIVIKTFNLRPYTKRDLIILHNSKYRRRKFSKQLVNKFISFSDEQQKKFIEFKTLRGDFNVKLFLEKVKEKQYINRLHSENKGIKFL